jgi:hypothetical protein
MLWTTTTTTTTTTSALLRRYSAPSSVSPGSGLTEVACTATRSSPAPGERGITSGASIWPTSATRSWGSSDSHDCHVGEQSIKSVSSIISLTGKLMQFEYLNIETDHLLAKWTKFILSPSNTTQRYHTGTTWYCSGPACLSTQPTGLPAGRLSYPCLLCLYQYTLALNRVNTPSICFSACTYVVDIRPPQYWIYLLITVRYVHWKQTSTQTDIALTVPKSHFAGLTHLYAAFPRCLRALLWTR